MLTWQNNACLQVRLVGYCTVKSLFLVYEFVDNGTLSQHLKFLEKGLPWWLLGFFGRKFKRLFDMFLIDLFLPLHTGRKPLSWPARLQIALDAARGLEYIHEHTTPTYIHRDIKSSNILIDMNLRAKVNKHYMLNRS